MPGLKSFPGRNNQRRVWSRSPVHSKLHTIPIALDKCWVSPGLMTFPGNDNQRQVWSSSLTRPSHARRARPGLMTFPGRRHRWRKRNTTQVWWRSLVEIVDDRSIYLRFDDVPWVYMLSGLEVLRRHTPTTDHRTATRVIAMVTGLFFSVVTTNQRNPGMKTVPGFNQIRMTHPGLMTFPLWLCYDSKSFTSEKKNNFFCWVEISLEMFLVFQHKCFQIFPQFRKKSYSYSYLRYYKFIITTTSYSCRVHNNNIAVKSRIAVYLFEKRKCSPSPVCLSCALGRWACG